MKLRADSSPRRRAVLLAALFAVLVPVALVGQVGCRKTPQSTGRSTRHTPESVAAMNDEVYKIAIASLRRSEQMESDEAFRQLIDRLNQWLKTQKPLPGWAIDPMAAPLVKSLADAVGEVEPSYKQLAARRNLLELKGRAQLFAAVAPKLQSVAAQVDVKKLDLLAASHVRAIAQIESAAKQVGDPARLAEVEARYPEFYSNEVRDKTKLARLQDMIGLAKMLDPPSRLLDPNRLGAFVQQLDTLAAHNDPKELKAVAKQFQAIITRNLGLAGQTKLWAQIGFIAGQLDELATLRDLVGTRILKRSLVDLNEQLKAAAARAERDDVRQLAAQNEEAIKRFDLPELVNLSRQLEAALKPGSLDDLGDFGPRLADAAKQLADAAGRMEQSGQSMDVASLRELADFCRQLGAGFGEIAARLKAPGEAGKPATPGKPAIDVPAVAGAFQQRMGEFQVLVERLSYFKGLDALEFPVADRFNLGEAVLSRDLARWVRGDDADDVSRAKRLFDWTIRNIQLEPDRAEREGKTYVHMMQFPWETMLFGRGTVSERIWQFVLLARQQGIDAAALALEDATDASHRRLRPWAVGVLSEGNVYVFEPSLGLPIPASGGIKLHEAGPLDIQPATLAQLAADDRLLRQLDADREHPYPVKSSDLKRVVALVAAEPWSLAQRMKLVESRLAGDDRMVLGISPSAQAHRFKAGKGVTDVRPWTVAYDTLFQRIRLGAEAQAWEASMMTPFLVSTALRPQTGPKVSEDRQAPMFWESNPEAAAQQSRQRQSTSGEQHETTPTVPLLTGRMLHLKGRFVGEPGATLCYQMCRLSDRQLAQLNEVESQQQLVAPLRVTKQFATYWLGLLAYEQRNYPSARDYLATRTLEAASVGPWTAGAKYNLGRVYEMEKQYAKAISLYRGNAAAIDGAGNRIRARWLESLAKPADLEKTPGPAKPKDEKETPDLPGLPDMPALPDAAAGKKPAAGAKTRRPSLPRAPKTRRSSPPRPSRKRRRRPQSLRRRRPKASRPRSNVVGQVGDVPHDWSPSAKTGPAMHRALNFRLAFLVAVLTADGLTTVSGMEVLLKDGRVLRGKRGLVNAIAALPMPNPAQGPGSVPLIEVLDDDLRRTFFSIYQVKPGGRRPEENAEAPEKIAIRQRVLRGGRTVKTVGPLKDVQPFDEFGRRTVTMVTAQGDVKIVQGITELTPSFTKVEGITHVWDMRMATSSLPQKELATILKKQLDGTDIDNVKRIANFYQQCERYEESARELEAFLAAHADDPDIKNIKKELEPPLQAIVRLSARRLLFELRLRRDAGQYQFVQAMLKKFPAEGAAGETLQEVREILRQYETSAAARDQVVAQLAAIAKKFDDEALRKRVAPVLREIAAELNLNTLDRMAAFREMADDKAIPPGDKLALAVSGWLLGSKGAMPRLTTAMSLVEVRRMIRQYLQAGDKLSREEAIAGFGSEEGANPALVARLLANMTPPVAVQAPAEEGEPVEFEIPGANPASPAVRCLVALPPEYDPHRRYPAIVTLHGADRTPEQQIDWWAGPRNKRGWRAGQASRYGYIVIAPEWAVEHQKQYQYSAREHAVVLDCLRGAFQRVSVDTDRVFLSGHSMGGDAAWDIGTAHPDLWAGVIPIAARGEKYCTFYSENAAIVPLYFVIGELDSNRMVGNSVHWDRYLRKGYNTTVVEYQGRGHENFSDEILRMFDWMGRLQRNFAPKKFTAVTMRPWDNFFWWIELRSLPPRGMVAPDQWPPPRGTLATRTEATVFPTNSIQVQTGAAQVTLWLSPEVLDLGRRVNIAINGNRISPGLAVLAGDVRTILEDARTRGDRQHPYWSKIDSPAGRVIKN